MLNDFNARVFLVIESTVIVVAEHHYVHALTLKVILVVQL